MVIKIKLAYTHQYYLSMEFIVASISAILRPIEGREVNCFSFARSFVARLLCGCVYDQMLASARTTATRSGIALSRCADLPCCCDGRIRGIEWLSRHGDGEAMESRQEQRIQ